MFPEDTSTELFAEKFPEDISSSDQDDQEEHDGANKCDNKRNQVCPYEGMNLCKCNRPSSPIEISLDEELEQSMIELEQKISLEMSDTD